MNIVRHIIHSPAEMESWKDIILHALGEIGKRSGARYKPEEVFAYLKEYRIMDDQKFALWLGIDVDKLGHAGEPKEAVTGLTTLDVSYDEVGHPLVFVSRGWTRPDDHGRTFKAVFPLIQQWGKERGCRAIVTMTERCSASKAPNRTDLACLLPRMRGLAAYWRQMARLGFDMRETSFQMAIK